MQVAWLRHLVVSGRTAELASVPEYVLSDLVSWLTFVIRGGEAVVVASKPMGASCSPPQSVRKVRLFKKPHTLLLVINLLVDLCRPRRRGGSGGVQANGYDLSTNMVNVLPS
jgi:hypothetical protein